MGQNIWKDKLTEGKIRVDVEDIKEDVIFRLQNLHEVYVCQNVGILLDNRRDLRANNYFRNSDGKTGNSLLCLVDGWGLGLSL